MSAVGMTAENVAVPSPTPVFSEVTLLPSTLKSFKRGYRISNELVRHSVLAIASVMGQAIVERTALEIDSDMFTRLRKIREGSGTGIYMLMNGHAGIAEGPDQAGDHLPAAVPVRVSTQVPGAQAGGKIILADMNQVAIGRDTAPSLGVFTETFADSDQLYRGWSPA